MHFSICVEKIKQREKKTSCKILCRSPSMGNYHLMFPDSPRRGRGCFLMLASEFSFVLAAVWKEPFVGVSCAWKEILAWVFQRGVKKRQPHTPRGLLDAGQLEPSLQRGHRGVSASTKDQKMLWWDLSVCRGHLRAVRPWGSWQIPSPGQGHQVLGILFLQEWSKLWSVVQAQLFCMVMLG